MLALLAPGTAFAGTFTRSRTRSAPVRDCEAKVEARRTAPPPSSSTRATPTPSSGRAGEAAVAGLCSAAAGALGRPRGAHLHLLDRRDRRAPALGAHRRGAAGPRGRARRGGPRGRGPRHHDHRHLPQGGRRPRSRCPAGPVRIAGIAKGSGMIAPDMATMLVYVFTDAAVERGWLQAVVSAAIGGPSTASRWTATPRPRTRC